jgi:hypothetical protein
MTRSRIIAEEAMAKGLTPLELMLDNMRYFLENGDRDKAQAAANQAAPYCHPRFAAVEHSGPDGAPIQSVTTTMTRDEFEECARQLLNEI